MAGLGEERVKWNGPMEGDSQTEKENNDEKPKRKYLALVVLYNT